MTESFIYLADRPQIRLGFASDISELLMIYDRELPNIVIGDVMMPELDGLDLCRRPKADSLTCNIPVNLLTARATQEDTSDAIMVRSLSPAV